MILIIDNYDSFTYNVYHLIGSIVGYAPIVKRNDKITIAEISNLSPKLIVISPGPSSPDNAGISLDVIKYFSGRIPIFGICLGHQAICQYFGGKIIQVNPVHGMESTIRQSKPNLDTFKNIPESFNVIRYHSLALDNNTIPECLEVTSTSEDGVIMSVSHKTHKTFGVQFHPESIGSSHGKELVSNILNTCGIPH